MTRLVLDTNVVVSAHLKPEGLEDRVLKLVLNRKVECFVSTPIMDEYERVLSSPKFSFKKRRVTKSLAHIRRVATKVEPAQSLTVCPDESDNRFLECADAASVDYLVTGNKRHFPKHWKNIWIVNARELIELIYPELER